MKLSTKGRYGVRLLIDIAQHYDEGPVDLGDIAKRQSISEKYLWSLIPPLKNAGIITSTRGSKGGYVLAKHPTDIKLNEIVALLEGPICLVDCINDPSLCKRSAICSTKDVWTLVSKNINDTLSGITIADMVKNQNEKEGLNKQPKGGFYL